MSTPESIVQAQTDALLRRLSRDQESQCRRTREAAEEQARSIVARAWDEARARLRQAVDEERRAIDKALADRKAALETVKRHGQQAVLREVMDAAWIGLPAELQAGWKDEEHRRRWCDSACDIAARSLHSGTGFVIEMDAATPQPDIDRACAALRERVEGKVEARAVPSLGAGLRIRSGRACVDATVPGLLASRERVESELLAELERLAEERKDA
jgi:F0F1-type ATP synthase membrane subunit b/b'